jgi:hypothetical protein
MPNVSTLQYKFDEQMSPEDHAHVKAFVENAFRTGEIISCRCPTIEAWVFPTIPPDFQASFACSCDAMRPLFSSTPDTE